MPERQEMRGIAESYAAELEAQFQRLSNFVTKAAGEIGRVHESYLRGILRKLLPSKLRVGTGFIAAPGVTSSQQDIIVFNHVDYAVLFEVAECLVVDYQSVVAALEVKTQLDDETRFIEAIKKLANAKPGVPCNGVYAWNGLSFDSAAKAIAQYIIEGGESALDRRPALIYARSKYLMIEYSQGKVEYPYSVLRIDDGTFTDGDALLAMMATIWLRGVQMNVPDVSLPWWIDGWYEELKKQVSWSHWPAELRNYLEGVESKRRNKLEEKRRK